jgi:hypothetical protein
MNHLLEEVNTEIKEFLFVWQDGKEERSKGTSVSEAFRNLGYSSGAIRALDSWKEIK